jgi:putative ABC transport system permease protein
MDRLWHDVRYGFRVLLRSPGFSFLAIVILGLGIGSSTTIFSAINAVLIRPLPYADPDQLVVLGETNRGDSRGPAGTSAPTFSDWARLNRTLTGISGYRPWGFDLTGQGDPERLVGARVSPNHFSLLGVLPVAGRLFVAEDGSPGVERVALLSEEFWERRMGADLAAINSVVELNGEPARIIGVIPRRFALPRADVWVPLVFASYELAQRGDRALSVIGRLRPGVEIQTAGTDLNQIAADLATQSPASNEGWSATVASLEQAVTGPSQRPLFLLFAGTCLLLLVACANLANLMLARSTGRRREIALRVALGASRRRIAAQLLTENLLLVLAAGAAGLAIALLATGPLARIAAAPLPPNTTIPIDPVVLGFALLVSLFTGIALAMIPVLDAARVDPAWTIKAGTATPAGRWSRLSLRDAPVVGQVALALLLLIGSGLLVRSFLRAQGAPLGFSSQGVLTMSFSLPGYRYQEAERRAAFYGHLGAAVSALPGVRDAGLVSHLPLAGGSLTNDLIVEGQPDQPSTAPVRTVNITPGYLGTMSIPVLQGRALDDGDRAGSEPVVLIDQELASRFWAGVNPVGRRVRLGTTSGGDTAWRQVVGVVGSVRAVSPELEPDPTIYIPYGQNPWPTMTLVVATAGPADAITNLVLTEVRALDPNQPVYNVRTMEQIESRVLASRRIQMLLIAGFAATAFLLAVLSVYGMLAYAVAQRSRELGIRVALGARRQEIVWLCLRRAMARLAVGLALGTAAALAATGLLRAILFGLTPWDPATYVAALGLLGGAGLIAGLIPAMLAARRDPSRALRET